MHPLRIPRRATLVDHSDPPRRRGGENEVRFRLSSHVLSRPRCEGHYPHFEIGARDLDAELKKKRSYSYLFLAVVFKTRGLLMVPPLAYVFLHFDSQFEHSIAAWSLGALVFFLGVVMRVAAQRHLGYRLGAPMQLATTGPFRCVRNPVYWGNLLILAGLAFMAETPLMAPLLMLWGFGVYELSVRFEERRLLRRFGRAYEDYVAKTPRWIPHFNAVVSPDPKKAAPWRKALAVEFHCVFLIVLPIAKEVFEWKLGGWHF